ncbi:hypothetical protein CERSUDRAFT_112816 [Gelatoporia subvermispora B]|uniref:Uncharacterized protein n=1 Tax=Ceriporiopsis subvermispora (strain B) TaxID=914234 RepID=M2PRB4_CERS8|nr:hypothetical protein CERSUDRAFT_112816 [Gelatoporia subvermispora B]
MQGRLPTWLARTARNGISKAQSISSHMKPACQFKKGVLFAKGIYKKGSGKSPVLPRLSDRTARS